MDPKDLDELEAKLDPAARVVVHLLRESQAELKQMLLERDAEIARLTEQLAEFQRMLFGPRTEKLPPIESEVRRAVEKDELTVEGNAMPSEPKERERERRRKARKNSEPERKKRRRLRKNLPVVSETIVVNPEQLPEGYSLEDFRHVGNGEVIKRIEHIREHLVLTEYCLQTLASKDGNHIVKAPAPDGVCDGGHYGPGVYAHVITAKCADSMPLYRIERSMERAGCPIARSTLCSFFHRSAELLTPIYDRLIATAKRDPYLHADETRLSVQNEGKCLQGWIWGLFCSTAIVYSFDESRSGKVAKKLLEGTEGFLIIDGYAGYNGVVADDDTTGRTRVGCWGHARRRFFIALKTEPDARACLDWITQLYVIEHRAAERGILGTDVHLALRNSESREVLEKLEEWLDQHHDHYPPKSYIGKAIKYAINNREELTRFIEDAKLPLDNNFAERGLRIIALGRKNFLFAGHTEGAQNLAILQSIVSTCRLHGVNPYEYVKDVLIRIQTHPASQLELLMPWNWRPPPEPESKQPEESGH